MDITKKILVSGTKKDNIFEVSISFPESDNGMSLRESAMTLASAIMLLIRNCEKVNNVEHELMTDVINYMQSEFVNNDSFSDGKIFTNNEQ